MTLPPFHWITVYIVIMYMHLPEC